MKKPLSVLGALGLALAFFPAQAGASGLLEITINTWEWKEIRAGVECALHTMERKTDYTGTAWTAGPWKNSSYYPVTDPISPSDCLKKNEDDRASEKERSKPAPSGLRFRHVLRDAESKKVLVSGDESPTGEALNEIISKTTLVASRARVGAETRTGKLKSCSEDQMKLLDEALADPTTDGQLRDQLNVSRISVDTEDNSAGLMDDGSLWFGLKNDKYNRLVSKAVVTSKGECKTLNSASIRSQIKNFAENPRAPREVILLPVDVAPAVAAKKRSGSSAALKEAQASSVREKVLVETASPVGAQPGASPSSKGAF
jgi:hypothetical protein